MHCDANNFYASVECAKNPALKGYALAVGGDEERRSGIILAKSNEAKKMGVSTGEPIWQAKQKCPDLLILPPDFSAYVKYSNALFKIYSSYTDKVECFGLDECWLDITDTRFGRDGKAVADEIRTRVKKELGITISVGVSFTKVFAKLGSDFKKPDATTVFDENNFKQTVWKLPVSDLLMVGRQTTKFFANVGIRTIGDLAKMSRKLLKEKLGVVGEHLHDYANGVEIDTVKNYYDHDIPSSVGNGSTASKDMVTESEASSLIVTLCESVATRLRQYGLKACGIHLGLKSNEFKYAGKQNPLHTPTNTSTDLINGALGLLGELWSSDMDIPLRAITVTAINLISSDEGYQQNFFADDEPTLKEENLEKSVDKIRDKYGYNSIQRGRTLTNTFTTDKIVDDKEFRPFKKN